MKRHVLIAGGGVTGLAAAYYLCKNASIAGCDMHITLAERDLRLGGKTRTQVVDGMVIEEGPDSFVASKPWLKDLCAELGLPLVSTNPKIHTTYIYRDGKLQPLPIGMQLMIPSQIWPFIKTPLLSPWGKFRAVLEPFVPIRRSLHDESIGGFVRRRFGQEVLENIAGPLMGGIYGGDWDRISLKATFPMFMKMEQEKGSLLLAARKNSVSRPKGSMGFSTFLTVKSGLQTVVDALVAASPGVRYRLGVSVTELNPAASGEGYVVTFADGEVLEVGAVILALPAYASAALVRSVLPAVADELMGIEYSSSVVVALAYRRSEIDHALDASGFLVPRSEGLELSASTWVSSKWPHASPADLVLFRCFLGRAGGKDWTAESDEAILDAVRKGLQQIVGVRSEPILTRVFRWPKAQPQYRVGHLERMDRIDQLMQQAPGLYLAGAAFRGVGLPDCIRDGATAAERVLHHLK